MKLEFILRKDETESLDIGNPKYELRSSEFGRGGVPVILKEDGINKTFKLTEISCQYPTKTESLTTIQALYLAKGNSLVNWRSIEQCLANGYNARFELGNLLLVSIDWDDPAEVSYYPLKPCTLHKLAQ